MLGSAAEEDVAEKDKADVVEEQPPKRAKQRNAVASQSKVAPKKTEAAGKKPAAKKKGETVDVNKRMGTKPNEIDATPGKKKKVDSEEFEESEESKAEENTTEKEVITIPPLGLLPYISRFEQYFTVSFRISTTKAKLFLEATKTRPHFSLPKA